MVKYNYGVTILEQYIMYFVVIKTTGLLKSMNQMLQKSSIHSKIHLNDGG